MKKRIKMSLVIFLFLFSSGALAQEKKPMDFKDLYGIASVGSPKLSPDGEYILYTVRTADWDANGFKTQVWRVRSDGTDVRQLTRTKKSAFDPKWSPCGKKMSFRAARHKGTQIYFMPVDGGEAYEVTSHNPGISGYTWSKVKKGIIYFTAADSLTKEEQKKKKDKDDAYSFENNLKNVHIWMYDVKNKTENKITHGDFSVRTYALSPDESKIAFIAAPSTLRDDDMRDEIYIADIATGKIEKLTKNNSIERSLSWFPDGKALAVVIDSNEKLETYYQESIFRFDLNSRTFTDLLPGFQYQVMQHFWQKKQNMIYFTANTGVKVNFFRFDPATGNVKQLTNYNGVSYSINYKEGLGKLVCIRSGPYNPFEVSISSLNDLKFTQVTNTNPQVKDFALGTCRTIHWKSKDGFMAEGILILPPDYQEGKKYPVIMQLHGGPESSYKNYFSTSYGTYAHVLAGKGYVVFQPNYRGSTGYGDACMRAIVGHYFEKDIDDLMTGLDYLIKEGIADKDKFGVMGWSAGGHLTNWLITHSKRFKAAASGAGMSNWFSMYAQTDMHYIREIWLAGSPYDNADHFREKSPINYVKNVTTPTIIFCGERDNRVPFPQSLEMYRGLKRNGCTVDFIVFPRAFHGLGEIRHQMTKMKKEFAWFEKYIMGR